MFSKALWVGWQELDDPPAGEVDAGLLGGILRDKFGAGLSSISDAQLRGNVCPARVQRATFLLTIPTSARDLPFDGKGPLNRP